MTTLPAQEKRILAIDPTTKGFGFAVLEGPDRLIEWGVRHAKGNRKCVDEIGELIDRFLPEVLVVEDTTARGSLRCVRVCQLIKDLLAFASGHCLRIRRISRRRVLQCSSLTGTATKRAVAVALSQRFPELGPHLPGVRKPWMSEDERMSIFDAVALAIAFFTSSLKQKERTAALPPSDLPLIPS